MGIPAAAALLVHPPPPGVMNGMDPSAAQVGCVVMDSKQVKQKMTKAIKENLNNAMKDAGANLGDKDMWQKIAEQVYTMTINEKSDLMLTIRDGIISAKIDWADDPVNGMLYQIREYAKRKIAEKIAMRQLQMGKQSETNARDQLSPDSAAAQGGGGVMNVTQVMQEVTNAIRQYCNNAVRYGVNFDDERIWPEMAHYVLTMTICEESKHMRTIRDSISAENWADDPKHGMLYQIREHARKKIPEEIARRRLLMRKLGEENARDWLEESETNTRNLLEQLEDIARDQFPPDPAAAERKNLHFRRWRDRLRSDIAAAMGC